MDFGASSKSRIFFAEAAKGYNIKIIIDILSATLPRATLIIDDTGILLRQTDKDNHILYNINLPRKGFKVYHCSRPIAINFNLKHIHTILKTVKKKDSMSLLIDPEKEINKLFIRIQPDAPGIDQRHETNGVVYQEVDEPELISLLPDSAYGHPRVIAGTDFQKIKKLTTVGKLINLKMQGDNFLQFKSDAGMVYDSELCFGAIRLPEAPSIETKLLKGAKDVTRKSTDFPSAVAKTKCEICKKKLASCECVCEDCGQWLCDCTCVCEDCNEWLCDCTCNLVQPVSFDKDVEPIFEAQYYSSIINKLIKLPSLSAQLQFYAPTNPGIPLKIFVDASQANIHIGTVEIYIKDVHQITVEESQKEDSERPVEIKKNKKLKNFKRKI